MNKIPYHTQYHTEKQFLEFLAGAVKYRRVASVIVIFGRYIFYEIPSNWYEKKGGKIRLSLDGWNALREHGGTRVSNPNHWASAMKSGRALYSPLTRTCDWKMPEYLEEGKKC